MMKREGESGPDGRARSSLFLVRIVLIVPIVAIVAIGGNKDKKIGGYEE